MNPGPCRFATRLPTLAPTVFCSPAWARGLRGSLQGCTLGQGQGKTEIFQCATSSLGSEHVPELLVLRTEGRLRPHWSFPGGASDQEPTCQCRRHKRCGFNPWVGKIPWRRAWQSTPVFLPRESHGQRSLESYSP